MTDSLTSLMAASNELANAIAQAAPAVVGVTAGRFPISGVHWHPGIVVTTVDAVRCRDEMTVLLDDGQSLPATLVGQDPGTDLAVLRVEAIATPTVAVADVSSLRIGHLVLSLGRADDTLRASWGILSTLAGAWRSWYGGHIDQLMRPDIVPYPGFPGGPLLNVQGHVLGINTTYSRRRSALTIPATTVNRVVDQLMQRGRVAQGYLGIGLQPVELPTSLQQSLGIEQAIGVLIVSLEPNGPADRAGILIGDILVTLASQPITSVQDLRAQLGPERIGQPIEAQLIRGGQRLELTLTVGDRTQPDS